MTGYKLVGKITYKVLINSTPILKTSKNLQSFIFYRRYSIFRCLKPFGASNRVNSRTITNSNKDPSATMNEECLSKFKNQLSEIFNAGVRAVHPASIIDNCVKVDGDEMRVYDTPYKIDKNVYLVGFGKAVMGMAAKIKEKLGDRLVKGIVSVPRGSRDSYLNSIDKNSEEFAFSRFNEPIDYRESSKDNQPDEDTLVTSHDIIDLAKNLGENDTLIVLISGGGSALFCMPNPTIQLESKLKLCKTLQNAGAGIKELNVVRKKLSMVKGGGFALMAHPAKIITLILSDIVGDPKDLIASGPTVYSEQSPEQVMSILKKYHLHEKIDSDLKKLLTMKETHIDEKKFLNAKKEFKHVDNYIIGNNVVAMTSAAQEARKLGLGPIILRNDVIGNVRDVSESYARIASLICRAWSKEIERKEFYALLKNDKACSLSEVKVHEIFETLEDSSGSGIILINGGEPEVTVTGSGTGGRNQELALRFSMDFLSEVKKWPGLADYDVVFLSAGTDGQDGPTDATGAFGYPAIEPIISTVIKQLRSLHNKEILAETDWSRNYENSGIATMLYVAESILPQKVLRSNDSYNFYSRFKRGQDLLKTGLTGTNVMDLHLMIMKKKECPCRWNFERGIICPDPLEEHDLHEDLEEKARRLEMKKKLEMEEEAQRLRNKQIEEAEARERERRLRREERLAKKAMKIGQKKKRKRRKVVRRDKEEEEDD